MKKFLSQFLILSHFVSVIVYYYFGSQNAFWWAYYYMTQDIPLIAFSLLLAFWRPKNLLDKVSFIFEAGFVSTLLFYKIIFDRWNEIWIVYEEVFTGFLIVYVFVFLIVATFIYSNYSLLTIRGEKEK